MGESRDYNFDVNVYHNMTVEDCFFMESGIKTGQIPIILYKYRSTQRLLQFLHDGQLMFATAEKFNDPYECKQIIDTTIDEEQNECTHEPEQITKEDIEHVISSCGIFCCTTRYNNIPMWAHYADNHTGCCLELDVRKDLDFFCYPNQVFYDKIYPSSKYFEDRIAHTKQMKKALSHKSSAWSYEREWRVIKLGFHGLHQLNPKALKSIILGIENKTEKEIRDALSANTAWSHVKLKKAEPSKTNYEINLIEL